MLYSRNLGLIWRGTAYSVVNGKTIFLFSKSKLLNMSNWFLTLEAWRHKMFKFAAVLICYVFAIINPFSWVVNASPETLLNFNGSLTSGRLAYKFATGAWPDHVWVGSSSYCFPRELLSFVHPRKLLSFDPWHLSHSPLIGKRIWGWRYNKWQKESQKQFTAVQSLW